MTLENLWRICLLLLMLASGYCIVLLVQHLRTHRENAQVLENKRLHLQHDEVKLAKHKEYLALLEAETKKEEKEILGLSTRKDFLKFALDNHKEIHRIDDVSWMKDAYHDDEEG